MPGDSVNSNAFKWGKIKAETGALAFENVKKML